MVSQEMQAYVQSRLVPVEAEVRNLSDRIMLLEEALTEAKNKAAGQDANLQDAEKRFEEIHTKVQELKRVQGT